MLGRFKNLKKICSDKNGTAYYKFRLIKGSKSFTALDVGTFVIVNFKKKFLDFIDFCQAKVFQILK